MRAYTLHSTFCFQIFGGAQLIPFQFHFVALIKTRTLVQVAHCTLFGLAPPINLYFNTTLMLLQSTKHFPLAQPTLI